MSRTLVLALAVLAVCLFAYAPPSLAGHGPKASGPHGAAAAMPDLSDVPSAVSGEAGPTEIQPADNPHSNKGGELRGLDRARQVAGEHGQQGRGKAGKHGHQHHGGH